MILLLAGLALFAGLHLFTTVLRPLRMRAVVRVGEGVWKGLIAVGLVVSIFLMVRGYGAAPAAALWSPPATARGIVVVAMLPVLILYMGSYPGSALRARLRHPQLAGFALWAVLHAGVNGSVRAVVLFGGLALWAVVQAMLLNRRDAGAPLPPAHPSMVRAWLAVPLGGAVWAVLLWLHPWLFGVDPLG